MRVLLCADGTRGDVHPLLELGARLRAAGHESVLCAPPDFADEAAARGLPFRPVGSSVRATMNATARALHGSTAALMVEATRYFRAACAAHFAVVPQAAANCDLVLAAGISLAGASAAQRHGIPYRYLVYCPILLRSDEHPTFLLPTRAWPRWLNRLSWRLTLPVMGALVGRLVARERRALGLGPVASAYAHQLGEYPVLAADRLLAPAPRDFPGRVQQIPCLHAQRPEPLPAKLEAFLTQGPPPVYLGFGSMPDPDPAATTRLVLEAVTRAGCRALISEGWAGLGGGPLAEGVMAIGAVSHAALFPRCAAVMHHGGAGTTTTAARAGVPQLVVPHAVDQFYWAGRVAALGLGPPAIRRRALRAEALSAALEAIFEIELLAERARELGSRLRSEAEATDPVVSILYPRGA